MRNLTNESYQVELTVAPQKWRLDEPEDKWVGKSAWEGRNKEKVTVEELALQHYEDQGFKG